MEGVGLSADSFWTGRVASQTDLFVADCRILHPHQFVSELRLVADWEDQADWADRTTTESAKTGILGSELNLPKLEYYDPHSFIHNIIWVGSQTIRFSQYSELGESVYTLGTPRC